MLAPEFVNKILEKLELKKPCQEGYEQIGMKMKDGKKVPNCVPIEAKEDLSSQKVELNLVDNLKKEFGRLQSLGIENQLNKIAGDYQGRIPKYKELKNKFLDAEKKAKELGVDRIAQDSKEFAKACDERIKQSQKKANLIMQVVKM